MSFIYSILNRESKNWWHHQDLRRQGLKKEAREKERSSIRSALRTIRDVKKHGGYLYLGNAQWGVYVFEHSTGPHGSKSYSLSGYYGLNDYCYYEPIFKSLSLPVVDTRGEDPFTVIKMPMIKKSTTWINNEKDYYSLVDYRLEAEKRNYRIKFFNI